MVAQSFVVTNTRLIVVNDLIEFLLNIVHKLSTSLPQRELRENVGNSVIFFKFLVIFRQLLDEFFFG